MKNLIELAERLESCAEETLDPGYPYFGVPELVREAAAALREIYPNGDKHNQSRAGDRSQATTEDDESNDAERDHAVLKAWLGKHRGRVDLVVEEDAGLNGEQKEQIGRAIDHEAIMAAADEMAQRLADYLYAHGSGGDVRDEYSAARARLLALLGVKDEWGVKDE